jgi:hypothetical protein
MTSEGGRRSVRVACTLALLGIGCADLSRGPTVASPGAGDAAAPSDGGGAALSFAVAIHPLIVPTCQQCHSVGQQAGDTQFLLTGDTAADYTSASRFVETAAPPTSRLLAKMSGSAHGGGTVYATGSPEYETTLRWIQQGAGP